jgi:hypothetical protein
MNAQIAKTYNDGSVDILTLSVEDARAHVKARTAAPDHFGLAKVSVKVEGGATYRWANGKGWFKECDMADVEHPGFPCAHPATCSDAE